MSFWRWLTTILAICAGVVSAVLTHAVASAAANDPALGGLRSGLLATAIATATLAGLTKILDLLAIRSRRAELKAMRAQFYEVFDGPVNRVIDQIEKMALVSPSRRERALHSIRHNVVRSTAQLVASTTARATYFMLDDRSAPKGTRVMHGDEYNFSDNRPDNATTEFNEADDPTSEIWSALDGGGPVIYPNLEKQAPAAWDAEAHVYKGFLTYRVELGRVGVGVLTVNSLNPDEFERADETIVSALAALLSAAEAVALGYRASGTAGP